MREGYVLAFGTCLVCREHFGFNPRAVPSLNVNGTREPICLPCMNEANRRRRAKGVPEHPILPDAYKPLPAAEV